MKPSSELIDKWVAEALEESRKNPYKRDIPKEIVNFFIGGFWVLVWLGIFGWIIAP